MQSNELLGSSHLFPNEIQNQLNMLYALSQQQISSDSQIKRIKKSTPPPIATDSPNDREVIKVVTTAGPQCIDKDFLNDLLTRKDVIPARKRRDFIPNEMKDNHYWERRRKNNLAAKRSREKRRFNDIVLETKVVELTNENEALKAKLNLMLSRLHMKEIEMENLFEEEQRLKPSSTQDNNQIHEDKTSILDNAIDLSRTEIKTGNLLRKSPSPPLPPSPSPSNESLLQVLANQILQTKQQQQQEILSSPIESKPRISSLKRNFEHDNEQAAMTLLSLNKPPSPIEQQVALQSVINSLLHKPNLPKPTIDYHNNNQRENFHQHTSLDQWKTLMNYFSMPPPSQQPSNVISTHSQQQPHEPRGDMMPLKLRMKMLNTKS